MDQMVGRAAGGQQSDHGVDDTALVHQLANRRFASQHGTRGLAGQLITQVVVRIHKSAAGHVQAHGFQEHLVAVGCAVKRAGAAPVVGLGFGFQQLGASHQTQRRLLAHLGFGVIGQTAGHRPCWYKYGWQMAKL